MNKVRIRKYRLGDKPELMEIFQMNVPRYFAEDERKGFEHYLDNEIEQYFVIELNGKIVGSGGINFDSVHKTGKLSWDVIHPNFHGKGLGTDLLKHRIELLKSINSIELISVRTSQFAYKFYEKNGFVLKEIHKDYWAKGFDMYKMIYK